MVTGKSTTRFYVITLHMMIMLATLLAVAGSQMSVHAQGLAIQVNTLVDNTTSNGLCSLREAIVNANRNWQYYRDCTSGFSADGIVFSNSLGTGTITLSSALPPVTDSAGLAIDGGGDITVSGNGQYQVFIVSTGSLAIDRLTVTNGRNSYLGGGAFNSGFLTITNSRFQNNGAGHGGGVYNFGGNLTITNSTFQNNGAGNNTPGDNDGGGVYHNGGMLTVTGSTFSGNRAYSEGGGIYISSGTATIANSTFSSNGDQFIFGAGIYAASGDLTITGSTFSNNRANLGGGAFAASGAIAIANSTFSGNIAGSGGGFINAGASATVKNSTFSGNRANTGAGSDIDNVSGTLDLYNTILANSVFGSDCFSQSGTGISGNNNLIESDDSSSPCGTGALTADPRLGALTGSPAYFPLNSGSPAIDAGDGVVCASTPVDNASQNGLIRPQGAQCDIGSYETPAAALAPTPQEMITEIAGKIQELVDLGALSVEDGKTLNAILDDGVLAFDKGDSESGIAALHQFIDQVTALVKSESLKPEPGQELIEAAQAILDSISLETK